MTTYSDNPKVLRLNEVFKELNYRSYNAFAEDVGSSQPVVANYMKGKRLPTAEFLLSVLKKFPQYNQGWLLDGEGEKYNSEYVDINNNGHNIFGNNNGGDNIIGNNNKNDGAEIKDLYGQLVDSLKAQIKNLEAHIRELQEVNEVLRKVIEEKLSKKD